MNKWNQSLGYDMGTFSLLLFCAWQVQGKEILPDKTSK